MPISTQGLHHVTAIATGPQANIEFYVRALGFRLVKRTVNYDDPETYHFYFGDPLGRPGSLITFFPWPGAGPAVRGAGEASEVSFKVPPGGLELWKKRLTEDGISHEEIQRFELPALAIVDLDGTPLTLTEAPLVGSVPNNWPSSPVPSPMALQGLHSVTVTAPALEETASLLTKLGMSRSAEEVSLDAEGQERRRVRLTAGEGARATHIDLLEVPEREQNRHGAGSIHHLALRVPDEDALLDAREKLAELGLNPTAVKKRTYFKSVYFREPGGAIFELATDGPGFAVDETPDELGLTFKLPVWLETERQFLRGRLPVTASPEYTDRYG